MKINKKLVITMLLVITLTMSFVGCNNEDEANGADNSNETEQVAESTEVNQKPDGAPDGPPDGAGRPHYKSNLAEIREQVYSRDEKINVLDLDEDGFLSVDEYNGTLKLFNDMDINGDQRLSAEETKYMMTFENIPTGDFVMGTDEPITAFMKPEVASSPAHPVTIDAFQMATTELTTAQYVLYLNSALEAGEIVVELGVNDMEKERMIYDVPTYEVFGAKGTTYEGELFIQLSNVAGISHEYGENSPLLIPMHPLNQCWINYVPDTQKFYVDPGFENWPAAYLKFYGAMAFSEYYELSLPTEAEWEYVARGGQQFEFPTDDGTNDGEKSNYGCFNVENKPNFEGTDEPENYVGFRLDVGKYPANPYGVHDLGGNVWEWTLDWYDENFYQDCLDNGIVRNPLNTEGQDPPPGGLSVPGLTGGPGQVFSHGARVCRGGSYNYHEATTNNSLRFPVYYFIANDHFGARFVIRPEDTEFNVQ